MSRQGEGERECKQEQGADASASLGHLSFSHPLWQVESHVPVFVSSVVGKVLNGLVRSAPSVAMSIIIGAERGVERLTPSI
jgi:hypothetical protein